MKQFRTTLLDWIALVLVVVGALNWGIVGIAHFVDATANWNVVNLLLGSAPAVEFAVYLLVGLAGLYAIYFASRLPAAAERDTGTGRGEGTAPK
ncbi:MAG: DUF378 domain-containing protein [Haloarculaceae archaeon]